MKLSDFNLPSPDTDYESITLSKLSGEITIKSTEFKQLGKFDGVVMGLVKPVHAEGKDWNEVHTTIDRIVEKLEHEKVQSAIKDGKTITFTVISGRNNKGTWYDIE